MKCPFCSEDNTKVIDSRLVGSASQVRRRRECVRCDERFTTYEAPELLMPVVIKRDGRRKPFDVNKLRAGINKSLEKRPIEIEQIEAMIHQLKLKLSTAGEREVSANQLGKLVMQALCELDQVAYLRFASVYQRFEDVQAFQDEIKRLQSKTSLKSLEDTHE
jgi:transcriptional repressor NrdR